MNSNASPSLGGTARILGAIVVVLAVLATASVLLGPSIVPPDGPPWLGDGTPADDPTPGDETASPEDSDAGEHTDERPGTPADTAPGTESASNVELVGHDPLLDEHQYVNDESFGIPRGSNGDVTVAGDCVYVGSLVGYQPPLIVDVEDPTDPEVVGPVPDAIPGVGNGIEGMEASGDVLVVDHRLPLGGLSFDVPEGEPERGVSVWDVSDCREPELVTRHDYGDLDVHALTLWRDPQDPDRLLGVQTFDDTPDVQILDLSGCPDPAACEPEVVAEWDLESQLGFVTSSHEAIMSTDGNRIYVAQYGVGVLVLDSSNLMDFLRDGDECDPATPGDVPGDEHCLTVLDPELDESLDDQPELDDEWQHTALKIPDRPYLLAAAESGGVAWDEENGEVQLGTCPGAMIRFFAFDEPSPGTLDPTKVGTYGVAQQDEANCGQDDWKPDTVDSPAWLSPHFPLAFPDVAFSTYYSAGLRAIDISDPSDPVEVGHFLNEPVEEVRWESYGARGEREFGDDGTPIRQPVAGSTHPFAFSYPVVHDGYVIYADVHSGLYVLDYEGPHADQVPEDGTCLSSNPGAVEPGYEPCPPYGETNWESADESES